MGATGFLLLVLLGGGVLAGIVALSRADWRVLDLGPLVALALAAVLGVGHGMFWYRTKRGAALARRFAPRRVRDRAGRGRVVILALALGARVPESSTLWKAVGDGSLGLRFGTTLARRAHRSRRRRVLRALRRRRLRRHAPRRLPRRR